MKLKLLAIFLFAFILRLITLDQSLWLDEATTANVVRSLSFNQIITQFSPTDFHPPLFYLLQKFWTSIFGYSEITLRFPSIIASLLTGYIVFLIGKNLKNKSVGLWAATLFLFNPLIIYYSQEARMYSLVTLFCTLSLYFFLTSIRNFEFKIGNLFLFNLFSSLSLFTHYGSIFFLSTLFIYLIYKKNFRQLFLFLPGTIITLFALSPLLLNQFIYSQTALVNITNWSLVLGQSNLKNLFLIFSKFISGRISFYPKILYYLVTAIISLITYFTAFKSSSRFLNYLFVFPLLLAFIVSFNTPMLQYFRYLYLIPVLSLLISTTTISKIFRPILLLIFILFSFAYLFIPQFHREDWRSLAFSLPQNSDVYMIPSFADPLKYYRPDVIVSDLFRVPEHQSTSELYIIPYGSQIYGFDYRQKLTTIGYHHLSTINFRGLTSEIWQK